MAQSEIVLGFDPGGKKNFGWAVCTDAGNRLRVEKTGCCCDAVQTVDRVVEAISDKHRSETRVMVAGIDAPLFWGQKGNRTIEEHIRAAVKDCGRKNPHETVQHINSLWGACLVQGILVAKILHWRFPKVQVMEAHPKALLWLLKIANPKRPAKEVMFRELPYHIDVDLPKGRNNEKNEVSEHERDAVLAAYAAWKGPRADDWRDLFLDEKPDPVLPLGTPVNYWMPM